MLGFYVQYTGSEICSRMTGQLDWASGLFFMGK